MAAIKGYKTVIHEQNAYPGITNKILAKFVDKVLITFEEAKKYFKNTEKIVVTGNPIRKEIIRVNTDNTHRDLGISPNGKVILSFGGSGGQKSLNDNILEILPKLGNEIQLIHVTGEKMYDGFKTSLEDRGIVLGDNIKILPYLYNMPEVLNIADLVITSAGAITLSELSAIGVASILIPKSYTAENHQEHNAKSFKDKGAAELIYEKDLGPEVLLLTIEDLINNREKLDKMRKRAKEMGNINANENIFDEISKLLL